MNFVSQKAIQQKKKKKLELKLCGIGSKIAFFFYCQTKENFLNVYKQLMQKLGYDEKLFRILI